MAKKSRAQIARDVIAGYYGSGDERIAKLQKEGYNVNQVQGDVNTLLCCRENIIQNIRQQAFNISNNNKWHYVYWNEKYGHECAICHPHGGENEGWQCIGFAIACWHHGGLPIPCNCGTIDDGTWEKILLAKTDTEALKIAQKHLGLKDIQVIRNRNGISKSQAKPGDMAALFINGDDFQHTYLIMSDSTIADSTQGRTDADDIKADRNFSGGYVSKMKMLIRYTGKGLVKPPKRTVEQVAQEVIDGLWNSGESRQTALKQAGYDYNTIQKKVNELLKTSSSNKPFTGSSGQITPKKKSVEELAQEVLDGKWGSGDERKTKLTKAGYNYNAVQKRVNELVKEKEKITTSNTYAGQLPTYRLKKTNAQVIADAVKWAKWIAGDNHFHYGHGTHAHHNGCYFCGTQKLKKNHGIVDPEHTYCCNPFVSAAWAHGGCVPKALSMCQNFSSWDFNKGAGYDKSSLFDNLGHPAKSKLKAGDVLCKDGHVALYIGNGQIVEAGAEDDNKKNSDKWKNSIRIRTLSDSNYANFPRVHRFNGSVNQDITMLHGEVSDRVALWQAFLDWYFDGQVGEPYDGIFGDNTLKWTKKFQEKVLGKGEGDGLVGPKTIAAAKKVKK